MEFAAIPKSLEGFLDSLLPALTQLAVFLGFLGFLVGYERLIAPFMALLPARDTAEQLANDPFVKESGVLKLVPIGILVGTLFLAIALERTVSFVGSKIPGQLSYSEPDVLIQAVPTEQLAQMWALYPAARDEFTIYLVLEQQIVALPSPANTAAFPWAWHDDRFSVASRTIDSVKFYLALGLLTCLAHKRFRLQARKAWGRYLVIIVGGVTVAAYAVSQQVDSKQQSDWAKVNYIIAKQIAAGADAESRLKDSDTLVKFRDVLDRHRSSRQRKLLYGYGFYPKL